MKVDMAFKSIPISYLGFVYLDEILFEVFQLKFWSDEEMYNCVMSEVERQRERSEERR